MYLRGNRRWVRLYNYRKATLIIYFNNFVGIRIGRNSHEGGLAISISFYPPQTWPGCFSGRFFSLERFLASNFEDRKHL